MTFDRRTILGWMAAAGVMAGAAPAALAQDSVSFAGQTIEWVIPFGEGGGNDVWARFFATYLGRHLPGNPTVIVRNAPGGGGLTGANNFAQRPPSDGSAVLGMSGSNQFPYLLGDPRVQYDYRDFTPVLVSPTGGVAYLPSRFGVADASELGRLAGQQLVFANTGPTSLDLVMMLAFDMMGLNVRHVFGMSSRGETRLALERGEATIDYQTSGAFLANITPMIEAGDVVPLFSIGVLDAEGNVVRDPTFPDIPHFLEAYEMMHGTPSAPGPMLDAYMAFFVAGFAAQKMVLVHNSTPEPIIDAYRRAFESVITDPELVARAGDVLGDYEQATGTAALRMFEIGTTIEPEVRDWMRDYLRTNHNVQL